MKTEDLTKIIECLDSLEFCIEELKPVGIYTPIKPFKKEKKYLRDGIKIIFSKKQEPQK